MAGGIIQLAAANNLKVPNNILVVGFDNINLAGGTVPPPKTIRQPLREIGEQALNCIMERIEDPQMSPGRLH
ncbi:MAG: substrate-binding domain-containing protein [Desulfobacterales bacterium]|nr:substrate-binding domain-containing protein [Desulfobacterales bacterium]